MEQKATAPMQGAQQVRAIRSRLQASHLLVQRSSLLDGQHCSEGEAATLHYLALGDAPSSRDRYAINTHAARGSTVTASPAGAKGAGGQTRC